MGIRFTEEEFAALQARREAQRLKVRAVGEQMGRALESANKAMQQQLGEVLTASIPRRGLMNKTEEAYAAEVLEPRMNDTDILDWYFEAMKLRLANGAWYTPDFAIQLVSGAWEMHEVKGFWREASRVRIKVAADKYPFRFIAARKKRKKDGGGWEIEKF